MDRVGPVKIEVTGSSGLNKHFLLMFGSYMADVMLSNAFFRFLLTLSVVYCMLNGGGERKRASYTETAISCRLSHTVGVGCKSLASLCPDTE